jgi:uncharacterized FlaG/YvyC family protein
MDMNIKGLLGPNFTNTVRPTEKVEQRGIKSDASHERDANGQQAFDQEQKKHGPMSDEQIQKAIEHLQQLPAVKEHKWTVELSIENDKKYILIKDNLMNTIRRIPEMDLWTLPLFEESRKGNLLKKTA